ncbi:alkylglycerol monooxygenase-like [Parasteatoda tepidariorum]|uniref:alkylglycerol monooxygenase-like n=1 Tax=Parasteatoda tepidariorum TaxID=114398 RepID=UPI001C71BFC0|nr:alkylglycerol monooxygenase-like isoform X1 [Parasteatoda tepidariorum]
MNGTFFIESIGHLFYLVSPNRTSFQKLRDVPRYADDAIPNLTAMFLLEICISMYTKKSKVRLNDAITCLSQGMFMDVVGFFAPGGQLVTYLYVYQNWRLVDLPWNSLWTWWFCFLAFDFFYYWGHRAVHEINILWATHHVHHSSEDYNISTNVRQSILQYLYLWVMFLPIALFVPLPMYYAHSQFSRLYQFWIHTELIKSLGPLEYVLNTPSHHRVHHGRNRNCIDKNYGATLIIWDRLFGTFEAEKEEILYGLTHPINSFGLFQIQFDHCVYMWKAFWNYKGIRNKLSVLFKGPGWSPGKPWHGEINDIPDVKAPVPKYDVQLPIWCNVYVICQFLILVQGHLTIMEFHHALPRLVFNVAVIEEIFSLYAIGILLDKRTYFPKVELIRCLLHFAIEYYLLQYSKITTSIIQARWLPVMMIQAIQLISLIFWLAYCTLEVSIKGKHLRRMILGDRFKTI